MKQPTDKEIQTAIKVLKRAGFMAFPNAEAKEMMIAQLSLHMQEHPDLACKLLTAMEQDIANTPLTGK